MSEADKVKRRIQELEMDDSEAKNIVAQTLTDPLKCAERIAHRVPRYREGSMVYREVQKLVWPTYNIDKI